MSFLTRPLKGMAMAQIKPLLDKFIKGDSLDADTVQVDTTGITINNVELNIDSLLEVAGMTAALPVRIEAAVVRRLKIRISWTELLSAPLSVDLDGVYVVATLRTDASSKEQLVAALAEAEAAVSARLAQAAAAHLAASAASVGPAEVGQAGRARTMTTTLVNRLADALRLSVRDVHIRVESRPHPALQHGGSGAGTADDWAEPQLRAERQREEGRLRLLQEASSLRRKVVRAEGRALKLRQSRAASSIRRASMPRIAATEDDAAPTDAAVAEAEEEAALLRQRLAEMLQQREESARAAVLRLRARRFQSGRRQRTRGDDHQAYAAGVTLASLTVSSITPDGELTTGVRGDKATSFLRKRVQVEGLGVYLDSGCRLAVYGNDHGKGATATDVIDLMRRLAEDRESDADGAALPPGRQPLPPGFGATGVPTPAEVQTMVDAASAGDAAPLKALLARHDTESRAVRREVLDRLVTPADEALAEASVEARREMRRWRRHYRRKRAAIRSADMALAVAAITWVLSPTSISLGVVLNDAGDPPAAELESLVRESLGMAWAETVAAEMPAELDREAALQALEASRDRPADMDAELDALEEQWDDFVSDPFAALCAVWAKGGGASEARGAAGLELAAQARRKGASVPVPARGRDAGPAGRFRSPVAGAAAARQGAARSSGGPVVRWMQRCGMGGHTQARDIARRFEKAACTRSPSVDASITVEALRLRLTSAQLRALGHLVTRITGAPALAPPVYDGPGAAAYALSLPSPPAPAPEPSAGDLLRLLAGEQPAAGDPSDGASARVLDAYHSVMVWCREQKLVSSAAVALADLSLPGCGGELGETVGDTLARRAALERWALAAGMVACIGNESGAIAAAVAAAGQAAKDAQPAERVRAAAAAKRATKASAAAKAAAAPTPAPPAEDTSYFGMVSGMLGFGYAPAPAPAAAGAAAAATRAAAGAGEGEGEAASDSDVEGSEGASSAPSASAAAAAAESALHRRGVAAVVDALSSPAALSNEPPLWLSARYAASRGRVYELVPSLHARVAIRRVALELCAPWAELPVEQRASASTAVVVPGVAGGDCSPMTKLRRAVRMAAAWGAATGSPEGARDAIVAGCKYPVPAGHASVISLSISDINAEAGLEAPELIALVDEDAGAEVLPLPSPPSGPIAATVSIADLRADDSAASP